MALLRIPLTQQFCKAGRILRQDGLGQFIFIALRKVLSPIAELGSLSFFVRELNEPIVQPKTKIPLQFRPAAPADVKALLEAGQPARSEDMLYERFRLGDLCFLAMDAAGRIVHSRWVTTRKGHVPELSQEVVLRPSEAYFYNGFTREDARGYGVDGAMRCYIFAWLRDTGKSRAYSYVRSDNPMGLRAAQRWQTFGGKCWYGRLRGFEPLVLGAKGISCLRKKNAPDGARGFRSQTLHGWFRSWKDKPLAARSTGFDPRPESYFISTGGFISATLGLEPGTDDVLDLGCDSAMVSLRVAPRCRRLIGVDLIPEMLRDAPRSLDATNSTRLSFASADGRRLPFPDQVFTKAYCCGVIHVLIQQEDGLRMIDELIRVCRPGGQVLVASIPDRHKRFVAAVDLWRRSNLPARLKLIGSLITPEFVKKTLRPVPKPGSVTNPVFLNYDLKELKQRLEKRGLRCDILDFPRSYASADFRRTRSNLLIHIPPAKRPSRRT